MSECFKISLANLSVISYKKIIILSSIIFFPPNTGIYMKNCCGHEDHSEENYRR